jgi:hypothetical protein
VATHIQLTRGKHLTVMNALHLARYDLHTLDCAQTAHP